MIAHCSPSSEWVPGNNAVKIKVAKARTDYPTSYAMAQDKFSLWKTCQGNSEQANGKHVNGTIAFPSEHKAELVRNRSIRMRTAYLPVPEIGTKLERNDCIPYELGISCAFNDSFSSRGMIHLKFQCLV